MTLHFDAGGRASCRDGLGPLTLLAGEADCGNCTRTTAHLEALAEEQHLEKYGEDPADYIGPGPQDTRGWRP